MISPCVSVATRQRGVSGHGRSKHCNAFRKSVFGINKHCCLGHPPQSSPAYPRKFGSTPTIYITPKMNFLVLSLASFVLSTSTYVRASKHCRGVSLEAQPIQHPGEVLMSLSNPTQSFQILACPPVIKLDCSGLCGSLYFYDNQNNTITTVMVRLFFQIAIFYEVEPGWKIPIVKMPYPTPTLIKNVILN